NLGDPAGAAQSYRKAARLLEDLRKSDPAPAVTLLWIEVSDRIARTDLDDARLDAGLATLRPAFDEARRQVALHPGDMDWLKSEAMVYHALGMIEMQQTSPRAVADTKAALVLYERVLAHDPADEQAREELQKIYADLSG